MNAPFPRAFLNTFRAHPRKTALAGLVLLFALGAGFADALLAGPMRTWAERMMNSKLNGYTVHISRVRPHLWKLAFDLDDLTLSQNTHPNPPVAEIGTLSFSLLWGELLHLRVGGNLTLDRPRLHINLTQIQEEARTPGSLKDRGWQGAVESIYPFKLGQANVQDGSLLYLSRDTASKPLKLTGVSMVVKNVRNTAAAKGTYPSPVSLEGVLFDTGRIGFKGAADFLREPHTAAQGEIRLDQVPLDRLNPLSQDYQMKTSGGTLTARGSMEYTPESQTAHLTEVLLENLKVDYTTSDATEQIEKKHAQQVVQLAKKVRNAPQLLLKMDALRLTNGEIGFVNATTTPPYRLFISKASLDLKHLSNQATPERSAFQVRGAFMGSGTMAITGELRPTASPMDFQTHLKLDDAKLTALNGFLMAHEGVDVADGLVSVYSEITIQNGRIEGYLKPLVKNLKIYERRKDQGKPFGKRVEIHVLQFLANLFKNHSTKRVATVIRISGSTKDPKASEWEAILKLIGNGLFRGILPGFLEPANPGPPPKDLKKN